MCNLYTVTTTQGAMIQLVVGLTDKAGNPETGLAYPNQLTPIVRNGAEGPELVKAQWSMPLPAAFFGPSAIPA